MLARLSVSAAVGVPIREGVTNILPGIGRTSGRSHKMRQRLAHDTRPTVPLITHLAVFYSSFSHQGRSGDGSSPSILQ